ncbi:hypothetical protein, partial [Pseudomonas aeruginosa]|uniref:hypothetical protein n=2 Tax=Pseudomonas aeruginosa TaxID=287 RepID=UPI001E5D9C04
GPTDRPVQMLPLPAAGAGATGDTAMSSTQHQLIEQCATRLRGIVEALDNIHDTSPHRWSTDLDDVHSSAESLLALIKDQAPTQAAQGLAGAALAQPSPASVCATPAGENCPGDGVKSCKKCPEQPEAERLRKAYEWGYEDGQNNPNGYSDKKERDACVNKLLKQPSLAQAEAARLREENANLILTCASLDSEKREMQHKWDAIIAERDAALTRVAELEQKSAGSWTVDTSCGRPILMYEGCSVIEDQTAYEVIRMIKWFGELEKQEPVALANRGLHAFWVKWTEAAAGLYGPGIKLYAAPVAQAQQLHDLDKQCRDDVARALGLRPNQERGFAWSYLLASIKSCVKASEDSAQAQHSVPEEFIGRLSEFLAQRGTTGKALLRELRAMLAAAPAQGGE